MSINVPSTQRRWRLGRRKISPVTSVVDDRDRPGGDARRSASPAAGRPRVVVAIAGAPGSERLIRGAAALARSDGAELVGVHVRAPGRPANPSSTAEHRRLLRELGGSYQEVEGDSVPAALRALASGGRARLVLGSTRRPRWRELTSRSVLDAVTRDADFDVHVIPPLIEAARRSTITRGTHPAALRRRGAWAMAVGGVPLLTLVLTTTRSESNLSTSLLLFVLLTVGVAALGGAAPALVVAIAGFLAVNWFLTPPFHTLVVARAANLTALVTFLVVGAVVSFLVAQVSRRSVEAARARADAETLTRAAREIAVAVDPVSTLLLELVRTFDLDGATVMRPDGAGWQVADSGGPRPPTSPAEATSTIPLADEAILALTGPEVGESDRPVLQAIADQVTMALEQRRLRQEASRAEALRETDRLRTALLRAVSHDLRTPLASIKASVSSLLQRDVDWPVEAVEDFLTTIEEETDRLNRTIGDLLDMGRLQADAVQVDARPVAIEEVVLAALTSMSVDTSRVDLRIDESSPMVRTDPALLERAFANLISNALAWSPPGTAVVIDAGVEDGRVAVQIVDRGPGIPADQRQLIFEPFQRLGGRSNDIGAGLGLAVARGFVEATGGEIRMVDTPGGGLTAVVVLERAGRA